MKCETARRRQLKAINRKGLKKGSRRLKMAKGLKGDVLKAKKRGF